MATAPAPSTNGKLSNLVIAANALPALVLAMLGILFYAYIPKFYSDVVGVPLTLLGILIIVTRLWDAITDPLIGALSDHTKSRFGRRLPWIAGATVPLMVAAYALFNPPETGAAVWFFVATFSYFLFWTMVTIPYESLGAELTFDYDERPKLYGAREGAMLVGMLMAGILPVALVEMGGLTESAEDQRELFRQIAWSVAGFIVVGIGGFLFVVRERGIPADPRPVKELLGGSWKMAREKGPFRLLIVAYTIAAFGSALPSTMLFFFVEHVLQSARKEQFMLLYLLMGVLFLPGWVVLARRVEKRAAWLWAMGINTGAFAFTMLLGPGDEIAFAIVCAVSGIGLGGTLAIPAAMQADVIDYDEWKDGHRREGQLIGLWSIAKKLAQAIGAGIGLPILAWAGYVQATGAEQPASAVWALSILYAGIPCLCNIVAIAVAWHYPIDRAMHHRIREEVGARATKNNGQAEEAKA